MKKTEPQSLPIYSVVRKDPIERYPIGLRYRFPDLSPGETISVAEVSVSPAGLILAGSPIIEGNEVTQIVEGGSSGIEHTVRFKITTSTGKIFSHPDIDVIKVRVT